MRFGKGLIVSGKIRYEMFIFHGDEISLVTNIECIQVNRSCNNFARILTNTNLSKFTKVHKVCLFVIQKNIICQAVTANMKYGFEVPFSFLDSTGGGYEIKKAVIKYKTGTGLHTQWEKEYIENLYSETSSLYKLHEVLK